MFTTPTIDLLREAAATGQPPVIPRADNIFIRREQADCDAPRTLICADGYKGIILAGDNTVIVRPPPAVVKLREDTYKEVFGRRALDNYTIHLAVDGTCVNLYFWEASNKWVISSARGYEINTYQWLGATDYEAAVTQALAAHKLSFESLRKDCTYSFLLTHPAFHPAVINPRVGLIHLQTHTRGDCELVPDILGLPSQPVAKFQRPATLETLFGEARRAYPNWKKSPTGPSPPLIGYILRARDTAPGNTFFIESSLMSKIRRFAYNIPRRVTVHGDSIMIAGYKQRMEYAALNAWFSHFRNDFQQLFPTLASRFKFYEKLFADVVRKVINSIRNKNILASVGANARAYTKGVRSYDNLVSICTWFYVNEINTVNKNERVISVFDASSNDIVYDFITDRVYFHAVLEVLISKNISITADKNFSA